MPIIIRNVGAPNKKEEQNPGGTRRYELSINDRPICTFLHRREHGLAECLREAARNVNIDVDQQMAEGMAKAKLKPGAKFKRTRK